MILRHSGCALLLILVVGALSGCGLMAGTTSKPQFVLPKGKRILVLVDIDPTLTPPAGMATQLAEGITSQLYKYKAIDHPVPQGRLSELRQNPEEFEKMGVADIAKATDADVVLWVKVITFNMSLFSDDSLTQGNAQALVKVIDANGVRMWPEGSVAGTRVDVAVQPVFTETRDKAGTTTELTSRLGRDVGRLFRSWARNENGMKNE